MSLFMSSVSPKHSIGSGIELTPREGKAWGMGMGEGDEEREVTYMSG